MTIKKEGGTFKVLSPTGAILGTFEKETEAQSFETILKQKEKQKK